MAQDYGLKETHTKYLFSLEADEAESDQGVSSQFKETVLVAGRTFTSKRNKYFMIGDMEIRQKAAVRLFLPPR